MCLSFFGTTLLPRPVFVSGLVDAYKVRSANEVTIGVIDNANVTKPLKALPKKRKYTELSDRHGHISDRNTRLNLWQC